MSRIGWAPVIWFGLLALVVVLAAVQPSSLSPHDAQLRALGL